MTEFLVTLSIDCIVEALDPDDALDQIAERLPALAEQASDIQITETGEA